MVKRQSDDGESRQPNDGSNDRTSGWKETQRETKKDGVIIYEEGT